MTGWNLPPGVTGGESYFWADDDMPSERQLQNWNEANDYTHEGEEDDDPTMDEAIADHLAVTGLYPDDPGPVPDEEYPEGLPTFYAVFQVADDRDWEWYAGWLELGPAFEPYQFHTLPIDEPPRAYATQEEARRACWRDERGY